MIGFILLPFVLAILIYIYIKSIAYIKLFRKSGTLFYSVPFAFILFSGIVSLLLAFFMKPGTSIKRLLFSYGYNWLGFALYFGIGIIISLLVRVIIKSIIKDKYRVNKAKQISLVFITVFTLIMSVYGYTNAHDLKITNYELNINKKADVDELNIAFVSDLHLGYNVGVKEMKDMVNKINTLNADVVLIGGDIFDNEYESLDNPDELIKIFNSIESKYGVYACLGNHDIDEIIFLGFTFSNSHKDEVTMDDRMKNFLNKANINILYDDYVLIDGIYIYGRPDYEKPNLNYLSRNSVDELMMRMDTDKPIIILDHEPRDYNELSNKGADALLSGHTHNGQFWPGTISIKWIWDNAYGYKKYNDMHNIVSSGVGLFGINMRTGSIAEVCNINLIFN